MSYNCTLEMALPSWLSPPLRIAEPRRYRLVTTGSASTTGTMHSMSGTGQSACEPQRRRVHALAAVNETGLGTLAFNAGRNAVLDGSSINSSIRALRRRPTESPLTGLEPSTPSLPWKSLSVARVHSRSLPTLFRPGNHTVPGIAHASRDVAGVVSDVSVVCLCLGVSLGNMYGVASTWPSVVSRPGAKRTMPATNGRSR